MDVLRQHEHRRVRPVKHLRARYHRRSVCATGGIAINASPSRSRFLRSLQPLQLLALVEQGVGWRRDESQAGYWRRVQRAWNAMPEAGAGIRSPWKMKRAYERVRARLARA